MLLRQLCEAQCLYSATIYSNNFDSISGAAWKANGAAITKKNKKIGPFGRQVVSFTSGSVEPIPCHDSLKVSFKLILDQSWDGNGNLCCGPDIFSIKADDRLIYQTTFSNDENNQSYPDQYRVSYKRHPAFTTSVVHNASKYYSEYLFSYTFSHNKEHILLEFARIGSLDSQDETWYMDDFSLSVCSSNAEGVDTTICRANMPFSWYGNSYSQPGSYTQVKKVTNGCDSLMILNLQVADPPTLKLPSQIIFCEGETITLDAGNYPAITWQDGSHAQKYQVTKPGLYSVKVTNACGAASGETVAKYDECNLRVPNAFSPNGDGINDTWRLPWLRSHTGSHVQVFNRIGTPVFETFGNNVTWDGTHNGAPLPVGTYYYIITASDFKQPLAGWLMLVK